VITCGGNTARVWTLDQTFKSSDTRASLVPVHAILDRASYRDRSARLAGTLVGLDLAGELGVAEKIELYAGLWALRIVDRFCAARGLAFATGAAGFAPRDLAWSDRSALLGAGGVGPLAPVAVHRFPPGTRLIAEEYGMVQLSPGLGSTFPDVVEASLAAPPPGRATAELSLTAGNVSSSGFVVSSPRFGCPLLFMPPLAHVDRGTARVTMHHGVPVEWVAGGVPLSIRIEQLPGFHMKTHGPRGRRTISLTHLAETLPVIREIALRAR
jgi:hypothetical protein